MADAFLHGNGHPCPACSLRREDLAPRVSAEPEEVPCNECGGTGRIGIPDTDLVRESAAWARAHYWPAREARWAAGAS